MMDVKKLKTAIRAIERLNSRYRDLISEIDSALKFIEVATENDDDVGTVIAEYVKSQREAAQGRSHVPPRPEGRGIPRGFR